MGKEIEGCILIISKSVYGLKTSGTRWYEEFAKLLLKMGFNPCHAGASLWIRHNKDSYDYVAIYDDDIFAVAKDAKQIIADIHQLYKLKGEGAPEYYLGGNIETTKVDYGSGETYTISAKSFINNFASKGKKMFGNIHHKRIDYAQVTNLNWMIHQDANWKSTMGSDVCRCDIAYTTNTLARYDVAPREGHLKAALRIVG